MRSDSENPNNVISLFSNDRKSADEGTEKSVETSRADATDFFADVMRRNEEARKRMAQDRAKANRGVLKSYRIKH